MMPMNTAGQTQKPVKAVILAAGYATRLYPLTLNIPKPLLKVTKDKAVIDFIVEDLAASGRVEEIIVVTNQKFYSQFLQWSRRANKGVRLSVVNDGTTSNEDRLGAIGDIHFAVRKKKIASDFVVVGGDNLFDKVFKKFLAFAAGHRPFASLGVFDIRDKKAATRFGVVAAHKDGAVYSFEEKPQHPRSTFVATCLYYFPQEVLGLLERYVRDPAASKDAPGNFIRWLWQTGGVYGFRLRHGFWYDIGHFDSYKEVVARFNR